MTREEAIDLLDNLIGMVDDNHDNDYDTALKMAIQALEQEPCEDISDDGTLMVNVKDGRKVTRVLVCGDNHFGGLYYPDEDAEPQTGHWILSIEDWNKWTCSECGYSERTDIHVSLGYDYCPKCGARMVEPTCDTCEYNTAAFNPCNACKDKSEYKPQERSE